MFGFSRIYGARTLAVAAAAAGLLLTAGTAQALVTSGNIFANGNGGSTVDHWYFTVNSAGIVTIDIMSWEQADGTLLVTDVNGDGEIAFIDPYIYLFTDDGSLDAADLINSNDDNLSTYGDGSINLLDSYLSANLAPGNYILAIGAYYLDIDDAIDGTNDSGTVYPSTCAEPEGSDSCTLVGIDHGDYRITWTGDLSITGNPNTAAVPLPAALPLFATALGGMGLMGWRRRRGGTAAAA